MWSELKCKLSLQTVTPCHNSACTALLAQRHLTLHAVSQCRHSMMVHGMRNAMQCGSQHSQCMSTVVLYAVSTEHRCRHKSARTAPLAQHHLALHAASQCRHSMMLHGVKNVEKRKNATIPMCTVLPLQRHPR